MVAAVALEPRSAYTEALADALGRFIGSEWGRPVTVDDLRRLAGGTSHETWAFDAHDSASEDIHRLVLRRDVEEGMLDSDLDAEFDLLAAVRLAGVAVPRPWWRAGAGTPLEHPFIIVGRVDGTDIRKHLAANPTMDRGSLADTLVDLQCRIHALDHRTLPDRVPRRGARGEVAEWTRLLRWPGIDLGPVLNAALSWLRTHIPSDTSSCLVHGDFKTNNLLFGADGEITVLDWELAHVGDPAEDLAWTMLWTTRYDLVGGLLSVEDYLAAYQARGRRTIAARTLLFWRVLALVKLAAIFLTGVSRGGQNQPTLHLMGRGLHHIEAELADLLVDTVSREGER